MWFEPRFLVIFFVTIFSNPAFLLPISESSNRTTSPRQLSNTIPSNGAVFVTGVGGGFYRMKDQQVVRIQSSNYGIDTYRSGEATTWRFFGSDCGVSATCPCFSVSSSLKCIGDYLKITDIPYYDQRFCGDARPSGIYRSGSGHLRIRFRSDFADEDRGFLCYISCTAIGKADPLLPPTTTCFTTTTGGGGMNTAGSPGCPTIPDTGGDGPIDLNPPSPAGFPMCRQVMRNTSIPVEQKVNWVPIAGRVESIL